MIKYKVIEIAGNDKQIGEIDSKEFNSSIHDAKYYFNSIDIYREIVKDMVKDWEDGTEIRDTLLIKLHAFIEYDLVEYDTDDESYKIYLCKKFMSFHYLLD